MDETFPLQRSLSKGNPQQLNRRKNAGFLEVEGFPVSQTPTQSRSSRRSRNGGPISGPRVEDEIKLGRRCGRISRESAASCCADIPPVVLGRQRRNTHDCERQHVA